MKRQIKFRGKRIDNGEWTYGNFFFWKKRGKNIPMIGEGAENGSVNGFEVDPNTIGQLTELRDKDGQEIYEGDIMEHHNGSRGVVVYDVEESKFSMGISSYSYGGGEVNLKIIGNFSDNPKLVQPAAVKS